MAQDSGPVPEPVTKKVKVEGGSQDSDGDKSMADAESPSGAAAGGAEGAAASGSQEMQAEGAGGEAVAALPGDEVGSVGKVMDKGGARHNMGWWRLVMWEEVRVKGVQAAGVL